MRSLLQIQSPTTFNLLLLFYQMYLSFPNEQKRKRLDHPRQAQDEPPGKALFAFLGGLACDLGAAAGRGSRIDNDPQVLQFINSLTKRKKPALIRAGSQ
jgi:hypothetical protein